MIERLRVIFVNKLIEGRNGEYILRTWVKDKYADGFWEKDYEKLISEEQGDGSWLTMDENLKACNAHYNTEGQDTQEFEVAIEYVMNDDKTSIIYAKVIE